MLSATLMGWLLVAAPQSNSMLWVVVQDKAPDATMVVAVDNVSVTPARAGTASVGRRQVQAAVLKGQLLSTVADDGPIVTRDLAPIAPRGALLVQQGERTRLVMPVSVALQLTLGFKAPADTAITSSSMALDVTVNGDAYLSSFSVPATTLPARAVAIPSLVAGEAWLVWRAADNTLRADRLSATAYIEACGARMPKSAVAQLQGQSLQVEASEAVCMGDSTTAPAPRRVVSRAQVTALSSRGAVMLPGVLVFAPH